MRENDHSLEALIDAEDQGKLVPWGFELASYSIVEEECEPDFVCEVDSSLGSECSQSRRTMCSLIICLAGQEKSTEQLAYELGFGTRLPLIQPYIQKALEAGLIERGASGDGFQEYWKIAR